MQLGPMSGGQPTSATYSSALWCRVRADVGPMFHCCLRQRVASEAQRSVGAVMANSTAEIGKLRSHRLSVSCSRQYCSRPGDARHSQEWCLACGARSEPELMLSGPGTCSSLKSWYLSELTPLLSALPSLRLVAPWCPFFWSLCLLRLRRSWSGPQSERLRRFVVDVA